MKKWIYILFLLFNLGAYSQELQLPDFEETDTLQLERERDFMYRQLLSGSINAGSLALPFQMPELDFNSGLSNHWSFDSSELNSNRLQDHQYFNSYFGLVPSPFFRDETVFSSDALRINDRFTMGGYSFGANSAFTAPFPNKGMNSFDVRGSSMFMQYKVSKNFKIETRVNVIQGPGPGY